MTPPGADLSSGPPLEKFKPTSGFIVGYAGLVFVAVIVGYVALRVHTVTGLQVGLGMLLFGLVIWMTQLRSRATAYADRLVLKNSVRDHVIPLVLVDDVSVRSTLNVWAADRRYLCVGIGSSIGSMFKQARRKQGTTLLGSSRLHEFSEMADKAAPDQTAMSYQTFVVTRIEELVEAARKSAPHVQHQPSVRDRYAWPEIIATAVLGAAFVASLLL